jgi:hypothetical protein
MTDASEGDVPNRGRPPVEHKSVARLKDLKFDPMQRVVDNYKRLEGELAWWEGIRDGTIVSLLASGKERSYSFDAHMRIFEQLNNVADRLMRYAYGRVPETQITENRGRVPFVINLSNGSKKTDEGITDGQEP